MDRARQVYVKQNSSTGTPRTPSSPMRSPLNRHVRSGSTTGLVSARKAQNAKAAAQRLAHVMAHQSADEDDEEDDLLFDYGSTMTGGVGLGGGRAMRSRSPMPTTSIEQPPSARSLLVSRPHLGIKTVPIIPATVPISLKPPSTAVPSEGHAARDKRLSLDLGSMNFRESGNQRSASALQDELDMLQEENENLLEKLRLAEDRFEEAEARARQLENQITNLGEGVTLDARLLSRKEAALQQREAALRVATQTGINNEIASLRQEAEMAREEAASALENLHVAESELESVRITTERMILNKEEMEEVVLKRCWLARYWTLCVKYGIHAEIAKARYEYWSSLAPLPLEVVLSAGHKAKEENIEDDPEERESERRDINELSGDGSIENMLLVEKGLRELASLKVEDAVALAMAQNRRPNAMKSGLSAEDDQLVNDGHFEAFELSQEESDDVLFKQAWLTYYWKRAKVHGLEPDIAEERLEYWINHSSKTPTSHDAVDVERGLMELRRLGIEIQLWEESRKELELDSNGQIHNPSDF
ncbi:hypothetical protein UlMin_030155 [Ulmus minor]